MAFGVPFSREGFGNKFENTGTFTTANESAGNTYLPTSVARLEKQSSPSVTKVKSKFTSDGFGSTFDDRQQPRTGIITNKF